MCQNSHSGPREREEQHGDSVQGLAKEKRALAAQHSTASQVQGGKGLCVHGF